MGRLVRGEYVFWEYLSQGGHEHWAELSKGTVVQGRIKVISNFAVLWIWDVYCVGSRILISLISGSRISDPTKKEDGKDQIVVLPFCSHIFHKIKNNKFKEQVKQNI